MSGVLEKTMALRAEAWEAVKASHAYADFRALDEAVVAMGGTLFASAPAVQVAASHMNSRPHPNHVDAKRPSHGDAAATALRIKGMPLPIGLLMQAAIEVGAEIGGGNPLANFRSSLSKDARFESVKRNSMYFWWFAGEPLPLAFKGEAGSDDFTDLLNPASSSSSQEGGDGHGPATT